jgi:1-deoxy-D-xylulose-5-phosphate reductoisomerase
MNKWNCRMKRISVLGSTGSIGQNVLKVAKHLGREHIEVKALAVKSNIDLLEQQIYAFQPEIVAVYDLDKAVELQKRIPHTPVLGGMEGLETIAAYEKSNFVVSAIAGTLGLQPTLAAINAGKDVALANKEALVSGGALVMSLVKKKGTKLIPIDSEHSAIFQCLNGETRKTIDRLILTASGGPFRSYTCAQLDGISVEEALQHPNWNMGPKVTIDSSTLMNKGLEVIEAHWLFDVPLKNIDVVIHPQSIIHSMVEFVDGSILAQMGIPSMIVPIQYALTYPERYPGLMKRFDFLKNHTLQFHLPDPSKFRCLFLAYEALRQGGTMPCYMNAVNEILVDRFLKKEIAWREIGERLEALMSRHQVAEVDSFNTIIAVDALARAEAAAKDI